MLIDADRYLLYESLTLRTSMVLGCTAPHEEAARGQRGTRCNPSLVRTPGRTLQQQWQGVHRRSSRFRKGKREGDRPSGGDGVGQALKTRNLSPCVAWTRQYYAAAVAGTHQRFGSIAARMIKMERPTAVNGLGYGSVLWPVTCSSNIKSGQPGPVLKKVNQKLLY